jgi:hypothetical protein
MFLKKTIARKFKLKVVLLVGFLFFILFKPNLALAARTFLVAKDSKISVGDTAIVDLMIDTEGKSINVIEGDILIEDSSEILNIKDLSVAGSALSFWPLRPSLPNKSKLSFVGGAPRGLNSGSALLFRIVFLATSPGQVNFLPANFKVMANDGEATLVEIKIEPLAINITSAEDKLPNDQWEKIISEDNIAPEFLTAVVSQDNSVFDGQKFMFISAVDNQSGLDYFEVKEGSRPTVRSGETYVLKDQGGSSNIMVMAYDKAGNVSKILVKPAEKNNYGKLVAIVIIIFVLIIVSFVLIRKRLIGRKK